MDTNQLKALEIIAQAAAQRADLAKQQMEMAMYDAQMLQNYLNQSYQIPTGGQVMMSQPAPQIEEPVLKSPAAPIKRVQPVIDPMPEGYTEPTKQFKMRLRANKPCGTCSFAASCTIKEKIQLSSDCGEAVLTAKQIASTPGELYMDIEVIEEGNRMYTNFHAYKDGLFVGDLFAETGNKPARAILENYFNQRVYFNTTPVDARPGVIFTTLDAEILRSEPLNMPAYTPPVQETVSAEAPFVDLVEPAEEEDIVLDFAYSL